MMYRMKNIVTYDDDITLPKCMYHMKNPDQVHTKSTAGDINISNQVIKFLKAPNKKMVELEQRQDQLLKKLDVLYDRIKLISSYCNQSSPQKEINKKGAQQALSTPDEIVVALNPDNLPWFINLILKDTASTFKVSWHIHSSVPNEKLPKIKAFIKNLKITEKNAKANLRLIFRSGPADTELKLTSLSVPIVGNVNILRYLSYIYPNVLPYDDTDYNMDYLLDLCHQLERSAEKNKEAIIKKVFVQHNNFIYLNKFTIIDIAVYNIVKQWQNSSKYVPKVWLDKCEQKCA